MKHRILIALLLISTLASARVQLIGKVKRGDGTLFNGKVVVTLPVATRDTSLSEAVCPCQFEYPVQNGTFPSNAFLVATDIMSPSNVYYIMQFFDPYGNLKMTLNAANVIDAAGTYDIGQATPTAITTAQISYITPASLSANQVWTGNNTFSQPIISTVAPGTAPLVIASNTKVANLTSSAVTSDSANVATTGKINLSRPDPLCWRNFSNNYDNCILQLSGSDNIAYRRSNSGALETFTRNNSRDMNVAQNILINTSNSEVVVSALTVLDRNGAAANLNGTPSYYIFHADGILTNTSGGAVTYTARIRIDGGSTILCSSAAVSVPTGTSSVPWSIDCTMTTYTTGIGATASAYGTYIINSTTGASAQAALITYDSTIAHAPIVTMQMSVSNLNASFTSRVITVDHIGM